MTIKLIWKVGEKPTGRYRSFHDRPWPIATFGKDGEMAAAIHPVEKVSYRANIAETTELRVHVADWVTPDGSPSFKWRRLKGVVVGVTAAKELYSRFLEANPAHDRRKPENRNG